MWGRGEGWGGQSSLGALVSWELVGSVPAGWGAEAAWATLGLRACQSLLLPWARCLAKTFPKLVVRLSVDLEVSELLK